MCPKSINQSIDHFYDFVPLSFEENSFPLANTCSIALPVQVIADWTKHNNMVLYNIERLIHTWI
jgi:hypothetical protein